MFERYIVKTPTEGLLRAHVSKQEILIGFVSTSIMILEHRLIMSGITILIDVW
jgi:hypothetical protein